MAISAKKGKSASKVSKASGKGKLPPVKKSNKSAVQEAIVKKPVVKKPVVEVPLVHSSSASSNPSRILTAEGWKRMQLRKSKTMKFKKEQ